jgi:hypothetical protein
MRRENRMIAPARARTVWGALLGVAAAFALSTSVAFGAPGNNGTIKVHDDREPSPEVKNQPHVDCPFHFHFFFADAAQAGDWWVMVWPPTGPMTFSGLAGSYLTDSNGEYVTGDLVLDAGHYKLFWEGDTTPGGQQPIKHKVFWVDESCEQAVEESPPEEGGGPAAGGEPTPFNGSTAAAPASTTSNTGMELAVLLGGGSALALVLLRPVRRGIRRQ